MHIYIAGIGGAGLGPLAFVAQQLGHRVSGSDLTETAEIKRIKGWPQKPLINIGQTAQQIAQTHKQNPIDWYIYSSALAWVEPPNPELTWVKQQNIKHSKRHEFLNYLLKHLNLKLLAVSGTHGKTTTTAMLIWGLQKLNRPASYALGGRLPGQPPAMISKENSWFVYEADEFDHNFLAFHPSLSLVTGLDHDHHEVYPSLGSYLAAFRQFIKQSKQVILWQDDAAKLYPDPLPTKMQVARRQNLSEHLTIAGRVNKENGWLAYLAIQNLYPDLPKVDILQALNSFPGSWRRFEQIADNLYSDYAHTPIKIAGCLQRALELQKPLVVIYQPHSNLRQHHVWQEYRQLFLDVTKLYWLPTYLAREQQDLPLLTPQDFIGRLSNPQIAEIARPNDQLKEKINHHRQQGDVVVALTAGDLDEWLRQSFAKA